MTAAAGPRLAVVVSGWPRLSETFALHELLALQRAGVLAGTFATKPGDGGPAQPGVDELEVERLLGDNVAGQAADLADRVAGRGVTGVHAYFAHHPAAVAERAAARLGVPFGFGVHALDVRKVPAVTLARRAAAAELVLTCNADAAATLRAHGIAPTVIGHGVDLDRFVPVDAAHPGRLHLLAVGRLVEKKGFDVLIDALAGLPGEWDLTIVGHGAERGALERRAAAVGIDDRIRFHGPATHADLPRHYATADIVVVPSRLDRRDDRDGLPNVVLEAMASGRPVVASDIAAIPSAVVDGVTGLLVPPDQPAALRAAITRLAADGDLRRRCGTRARRTAEHRYGLRSCTERFVSTMAAAYG